LKQGWGFSLSDAPILPSLKERAIVASEVILEFKEISKHYPGVQALDSMSFQVLRGEVHAIVGENGAGKSTLLKILSGLTTMNSGKILLNGEPVTIGTNSTARQLSISIIPQEISLIPKMTVADNVFMGHYPAKLGPFVDSQKLIAETDKLINLLKTDQIHSRDLIENYSTAKKQIVEIIKALSFNVSILALDEPTSSLSRVETDHLFELLKKLQSSGVTILFISHQLKEVFQIADRITVLKDGKYVATRKTSETDIPEVVKLMVGRALQDYYPPRTPFRADAPEVLNVRDLERKGEFSGINFTLRKGEILGVFGLVGAGRSEIVKAIFGASRYEKGEILLDGHKVELRTIKNAISSGIGLAPEDRHAEGLVLCLSVLQNLTLPILRRLNSIGFLKLKSLDRLTVDFMKNLNVKAPSRHTTISSLSGGNQQKVSISKWLAANSKVLIMDEPTRGVDVGAKAEIYRIMKDLTSRGISIIMISSELPEILNLSDRIIVIAKGKISYTFEHPENLKEEEILAKCVTN
jgi:ABC-type sugar transport system ATPase subunit